LLEEVILILPSCQGSFFFHTHVSFMFTLFSTDLSLLIWRISCCFLFWVSTKKGTGTKISK
jgi:hypothetical protein